MLPFLGKDENTLRRLESQLQQRDCQISNLEASLAKARADVDQRKGEIDQLRHALREANGKTLQQEEQLERYNKELKPRKEQCAWLQEQVTYLKKVIETKAAREKDIAAEVHHKTEETDRLRTELQAARRELEHAKASLLSTDAHAARFKSDADAEIIRLRSDLGAKERAISLLEDSLKGEELTEEQKDQLQKAALYDQIHADLAKAHTELRAARCQVSDLEGRLHEAEVTKGELQRLRAENEKFRSECQRLGGNVDASQKYAKELGALQTEKHAMMEGMQKLEAQWEQQNRQIQDLNLQLEAQHIKEMGLQSTSTKLTDDLKNATDELTLMQGKCNQLQEENGKLYEHVSYTMEQLSRAKDVINAKQGILDNERAMIDGDRRYQESAAKVMQNLRSELEVSRGQVAELAAKDKKAADAIQALERKIAAMRTEAAQVQAEKQFLSKELKASQVEVLRVQQQLNAMTEKMALYKSRLSHLRDEVSESEKSTQLHGANPHQPKPPEFFELQERVKMLEEELVAERNAHGITKNMLKQESEHRAAQSGTTHVSTPYPVPGSNFRFSYCCKAGQSQTENETPGLTPTKSLGFVPGAQTHPAVAGGDAGIFKKTQSMTPVTEAQPKQEAESGAMDVDLAPPAHPPRSFGTPGPTHIRQTEHSTTVDRRPTVDFHDLSVEVYQDFGEKSNGHQ